MLATFIIEIACAVYVLWRYKLTLITRLVAAILIGLAIFQLAEYNICEGSWGLGSLDWARIGYVAITLLPPLGLHLATRLADQSRPALLGAAYGAAAVFSFFFLFVGHGLQVEQCLGNYVIFNTAPWAIAPYAVYYYGLLFLGVGYALQAGKVMKSKNKRRALYALMLGYLAFIIPTTTVNIVDPATIAGIPSIMCGFAVLLALILTFGVLPRYYAKR